MNAHHDNSHLHHLIIAVLAVLAALLLGGCKTDMARDQAAADAIAGVDAMVMVAPETAPIGVGVELHALATRGKERRDQLPAPQMAPAAIVADADIYQDQGRKAVKDSLSVGFWAAAGGVLVLALGAIKATGLGGSIVTAAASLLLSAKQKVEERRRGDMAGVGQALIEAVETADPAIAQPMKKLAKDAIGRVVGPEGMAVVARVVDAMARPDPVPPVV